MFKTKQAKSRVSVLSEFSLFPEKILCLLHFPWGFMERGLQEPGLQLWEVPQTLMLKLTADCIKLTLDSDAKLMEIRLREGELENGRRRV